MKQKILNYYLNEQKLRSIISQNYLEVKSKENDLRIKDLVIRNREMKLVAKDNEIAAIGKHLKHIEQELVVVMEQERKYKEAYEAARKQRGDHENQLAPNIEGQVNGETTKRKN